MPTTPRYLPCPSCDGTRDVGYRVEGSGIHRSYEHIEDCPVRGVIDGYDPDRHCPLCAHEGELVETKGGVLCPDCAWCEADHASIAEEGADVPSVLARVALGALGMGGALALLSLLPPVLA